MTIDPYSPCPGGIGKKIKFCCPDLVHELDKLQRMIDGEQRVAGLDYVTKLDAKYPGRACLLSARATLEAMLGNREQSAATLATFREKHPDNPIALAELAVLQATGENPLEAIGTLQRALAVCGDEMPEALYEAYGGVAHELATAGHYVPAMALFSFQAAVSQGQDKQALEIWAAFDGDPDIPILLKHPFAMVPPPPNAPWRYEFELAFGRGARGFWQIAAEKFAALAPIAGQSPELWQNLARLREWMGDYAGAIEALRKYAALDVPLDDAVEAEAEALILQPQLRANAPSESPTPVDDLMVTMAVVDQSAIEERFAADKQLERMPIDASAWAQSLGNQTDEPPPRSVYSVIDRPLPSAEGLTREQVPITLGVVLLFGRQTDRPERLELMVLRSDLAAMIAQLRRIGGEAIGDVIEEKVLGQRLARESGLNWHWRFPRETPIEKRHELIRAESRHRLLEIWPDTPLSELDGQTPRQAAANPSLRRRVSGLLLTMELAERAGADPKMFDDLRQRLGLPIPESIDPGAVDLKRLPRVRLDRLIPASLSDDDLIRTFRRAGFPPQRRAMVLLATEIVARPSFHGRAETVDAYMILARSAQDTNTALSFIEPGRAAAQRAKQSTASWDLEELQLRLQRGEGAEFSRLMQHVQREHIDEPGVSEALFRLLYENGIIDKAGRPIAAPPPQSSPLIVPGAAAPGKLLVPGGESAAAAAGSSKPVIWTPGMD